MEKEKIDEIIKKICDFFSVEEYEIMEKNHFVASSTARNFVYYILHTKYKMSSKKISKLMNRTDRNIKYRNSTTKYLIENNKDYEILYTKIMSIL